MAKARAVLKRLKAVKNIRKITRTMELIATARFKKAMDRAVAAAAYTKKIAELASDLSKSASDFTHPLMEVHEPRKTGVLLVITSNRGLCGGYNSSVLKLVLQRLRAAKEAGENLIVEVAGKGGVNFFKFQKVSVDRTYLNFEDKPRYEEVDEIATRYIEWYVQRKIDFVEVLSVRFLSASKQQAQLSSLLPLAKVGDDAAEEKKTAGVEYEFLPSAKDIIEEILPTAFKSQLFKCFLDAAVSEQIARRVAMKAATENAGDMISSLSRVYNRARQSQITSELSEIIGGAEALN